MSKPSVGFIGLGSQGGPMAMRIVEEGFPLTVWARRPEALEPYLAKGATAAASPAALAEACDIICLCVVDDAGIADLADQIIPAMRPGSLLIIHSTILPESCEALDARCKQAGLLFLDAPVSGGGMGATARTLTIMCGGSAEAFARARPVFDTFGGLIVHLGGAGSGQRAKLINNALLAAKLGLSHAALSAGEALGIDRAMLAELINASTGRSYGFEIYARMPQPIGPWLGTPLLKKDVGLLTAALPGHDHAALLHTTAHAFFTAANSNDTGDTKN